MDEFIFKEDRGHQLTALEAEASSRYFGGLYLDLGGGVAYFLGGGGIGGVPLDSHDQWKVRPIFFSVAQLEYLEV